MEGRVVSQAVLVVVGFTSTGEREVLHWAVGDSESEATWSEVFCCLKKRGLTGVKLVVSDAHQGIARHYRITCRAPPGSDAGCTSSGRWAGRCRTRFSRS